MSAKQIPIPERFWSKVERRTAGECWEWKAGFNLAVQPRPIFWIKRRQEYAHRVAFSLIHGPIPEGKWVCRRCDNPKCVNPNHLFLGTPQINHDDMKNKGRRASFVGEKNSQSKLNATAVRLMRALYLESSLSKAGISRMFGVSAPVGNRAIRGETWSHV